LRVVPQPELRYKRRDDPRRKRKKIIRPFIAGVVQGIYRFKTDRAFAKRQVAKYLRIDDDKVLEETHNLFADLSEELHISNVKASRV